MKRPAAATSLSWILLISLYIFQVIGLLGLHPREQIISEPLCPGPGCLERTL